MKTYHDYESLATVNHSEQYHPALMEAYSGAQIVGWYGNIQHQLERMLDEQEAARNYVYADKIREFLKVWRGNELTGSINRETLEVLKTACSMLGVDKWNLKNYFSTLRDQIRKLIASEEELPRGTDMEQNSDFLGGGGGAGGDMPPMNPDFGPTDKPPGNLGGEEGAAPPGGADDGSEAAIDAAMGGDGAGPKPKNKSLNQ